MINWTQFLERKKKKKIKMSLDIEGEPVIVGESSHEGTATVAVFTKKPDGLYVLVGKRKKEPQKDKWCLPGGHMDPGETPEDAGIRELREETGVSLGKVTYLRHRLEKKEGLIHHYFFARVSPSTKIKAGSDIADVQWMKVKKLEPLAFNHSTIVHEALTKMPFEN